MKQVKKCEKLFQHTSRRLKMARSIITLRDEDVVSHAAFQRLIQRDRRALEFFLDPAEPVQARLQLEMVVALGFGDGGDDGDVVALGADVVCRGDDGDIDV